MYFGIPQNISDGNHRLPFEDGGRGYYYVSLRLLARIHKMAEQHPAGLVNFEEILGMPLDSPEKTARRPFKGFDQAIRRKRHRHESRCERFHGLMVQAIDRQNLLPQQIR